MASPSGPRVCSSQPDPSTGRIAVIRIRSGFVQNVLGFNVTRDARLATGWSAGSRSGLALRTSASRCWASRPPSRHARPTSSSRRPGERYRRGARSASSVAGESSWMPRSFTPTAWAARARPAASWAALAASPGTAFCFLRSTRVFFTARLHLAGLRATLGIYDPTRQQRTSLRDHAVPAARGAALLQPPRDVSRCSWKPCGSG